MNEEIEKGLRERLGIPAEAERAIVFGESSHWDPNWLLTSEKYYRLRIGKLLDAALAELEREPRRVYSVECVFFLEMYWDRNPEKRDLIRRLVNEGRIRLTGSGVTTPDTVLPHLESIFRDYLNGQNWLRDNGMNAEPRVAYLPDDFGYSPTTPSVLAALGFDYSVITRIDGMYFPGTEYRGPAAYPLPGSSAELLAKDLKTADFIWLGPDGAKTLCHWNAFTYFQGDMIASAGAARWMGLTFGFPARSPEKVAKKIAGYVKSLSRLSRVPYLFCPIGCDFVEPIPGLVGLLDAYNRSAYAETGVYAVNASAEDYMDLVAAHADKLPRLALEATPYWMGYYSSRPEMKQRCNRLADRLILAEKLLTMNPKANSELVKKDLADAWRVAAVANHHDFITGTSPNRVFISEQLPWLEDAAQKAERALEAALDGLSAPPAGPGPSPVEWELKDGLLTAESKDYAIVMDGKKGGCITSWLDKKSGREAMLGLGNDVVLYLDTGGLWRMGHEYPGGKFKRISAASDDAASIGAEEKEGLLEVTIESKLEGRPLERKVWLRGDSEVIRARTTLALRKRRTATCRFTTSIRPFDLLTDAPGGSVRRPLAKIYNPTFWPAKSYAAFWDGDLGVASLMSGPAAVGANSNGVLEWVAARNAPNEIAFGFLPMLAHPASGPVPGPQTLDYAFLVGPGPELGASRLHAMAQRSLDDSFIDPSAPDLSALAARAVRLSRDDVFLVALKEAHYGGGLIARLLSLAPGGTQVEISLPGVRIEQAHLCDGRERDLEEIKTEKGKAVVKLNRAVTSVRLNPW